MTLRIYPIALIAGVACSAFGQTSVAADPGASRFRLGPNLLGNGDFSSWPGYRGRSVTTTSVGVPPRSIPEHWQGGPGIGATATYGVVAFAPGQTDVPGHPRQFLSIQWRVPPSANWPGDAVSLPGQFRMTFLENFSIGDVSKLAGRSAVFRFYGRTNLPSFDVVPILWHSYDSIHPGIAGVKGRGFELFEASGRPGVVAIAGGTPHAASVCHLTNRWQRFERIFALPTIAGKSITPGHYTGAGFDLVERRVVTIDLARVEVRPILNEVRPILNGATR